MKSNLFLIGILVVALALTNAMALSITNANGIETKQFTTITPVYVKHPVTVYCNTEITSQAVNVYIVSNRNWTVGDNITGIVVNTTLTTSSAGKLPTSLLWDEPEVGLYDVIVDLNKNGKYDASGTCVDLLADDRLEGFSVTESAVQNTTGNNTTANQTQENTTTNQTATVEPTVNTTAPPAQNNLSTNTTATGTVKADYTPYIIIALAIIIAGIIIAITLMRMR